ncbi:hypothetical protein ACFFQF_26055 [Haladaptatus pallidirubidus]|uniref:hypothetical protein n=1 Tax=Haladaptatus pallidirubidus TaxID=1008152 RepID=UPI0035ED6F33
MSGPVVDRRTTMKLLGAAGITSLAGCTGGGGGSGDGNGDGTTGAPSEGQRGGRLSAGWFTGSIDVLDPRSSASVSISKWPRTCSAASSR